VWLCFASAFSRLSHHSHPSNIEDLRLHVWSSVSKHHASRKLCLLSKPPMTNKESQWTVAAVWGGIPKHVWVQSGTWDLARKMITWYDTWYDIRWIIMISEGAPDNKSRWQENLPLGTTCGGCESLWVVTWIAFSDW
jgi:hypothetical protein